MGGDTTQPNGSIAQPGGLSGHEPTLADRWLFALGEVFGKGIHDVIASDVFVLKKGILYSDTNYAPWDADWAPEAGWVVKLWKQHKLSFRDLWR